MNETDKRRLARAVKDALAYITSEARCYYLQEEPEYLEIKNMLEAKIQELKEEDNE